MKLILNIVFLLVAFRANAQLTLTEEDKENLRLLYETAVISTDRDYYYPGDVVWYKVAMKYQTLSLSDSLSRVLYVELMEQSGKTLATSVIPISMSGANGYFLLPKTSTSGVYAVRAYTNWMKNYANPIPSKLILVMRGNVNVACNSIVLAKGTEPVTITLDKEKYACRQKVRLTVKLNTKNASRVQLSASVVDAFSCPNLTGATDIFFQAQATAGDPTILDLTHTMEKGISIYGQVQNQKGAGVKSNVNVFQSSLGIWDTIESDDDGKFSLTGYNFSDSLPFMMQSVDRKGKPNGRVDVLNPKSPAAKRFENPFKVDTVKADVNQRIVNTIKFDDDVKVLDELVVKGHRIEKEVEKREKLGALYKDPDFVINGDDLIGKATGDNWILALDGKIPGFKGGKVSRTKGSTFSGDTGPLILIDGVALGVPLSSIPAASIERVEIVKNASAIYGSRGSNGIIAVYTKSSGTVNTAESAQVAKPDLKYIRGYDSSIEFPAPNYTPDQPKIDQPDFRITLHWEPVVQFNEDKEAVIEFYTADLSTTYYVRIEGLVQGYPIKVIKSLNVECN